MKRILTCLMGLLFCLPLFAQNRTITGRVTDDKGSPLSGVSVLVKGSSVGTTTNAQGTYSLPVPSGARTLVFSFADMSSNEVSIGNASVLNTSLQSADRTLQEVVVTGVGVATSKRKVAIAVESISAKDLPRVPQGSIDQALVGKIAGAQISSTSGQPGQQAQILLRGINTLGSTQPMILVDGVQINASNNRNGTLSSDDNQGRGSASTVSTNQSSRLSDIDLSNIERVEVIQGAAAATIYGAQGANGVIQIFTKKGARNGKTSITVNSRASIDNALKGNLKFADRHFYETDAEGYIISNAGTRLSTNSATGQTLQPKLPASLVTAVNDKPYREPIFDNLDAIFRENALSLNNSVTISGGRDKSDYSLTLSHLSQQSIFAGDYKRSNASINLGTELFKNFSLRSITQVIYSDNSTGGITGQNNIFSPVNAALLTRRYLDLTRKDSLGNYMVNPQVGETSVNPFYTRQFREWRAENTRVIQNFNLNYKPFRFLEIDYKFGLDNYRYDYTDLIKFQQNTLTPALGITPINGRLTYDNFNETYRNSLLSVFVKTDFERDFKINVPITTTTHFAYDYRKNKYRNTTTQGTGFTPFPPNNLNGTTPAIGEENSEFVTFGYLVNQRVDFGELFGVSGGVRADYSSAFGSGSNAFVFPRADAYFRLGQLLKAEAVKEFKLRGAWGKAGIQPRPYDRFITLTNGNFGTNGYLALNTAYNNQLLNVEVSSEAEVGADMIFQLGKGSSFRNIRVSATYWDKSSKNVIRPIDLAPSVGAISIIDNAIDLKAKGFQASLDADLFNQNNFTWDFGIRFGTSKSTVDRISNGKDIALGSTGAGQFVLRQGASVGAFFGFRPLRDVNETTSAKVRYIPDAQVGNFEVVNGYVVNKTTKAVVFTTELQPIGDPNPKFNMTFLNNFTLFKNLSIATQLDWVYGNKIYNQTRQWLYRDYLSSDFDVPVTVNGETKAFVNYYNSLYNTNNTNTHFVEDGSFLRLRELTFNYNVTKLLKAAFVRNAQISLSGRNLFTITNYTGMDPEAAASLNNPLRRGLDLFSFPNFKTYQVALTLGF
ncbi:MAG TPA: SusC/RagA family TonB-linked outer membrane protein [Flavisolibacter sp.]|nr:SusC/RagA family TonB-linked outer membrane protein [Flavisolibacter sp.]